MKRLTQTLLSLPVTIPAIILDKLRDMLEWVIIKYHQYIYEPYSRVLKKLYKIK